MHTVAGPQVDSARPLLKPVVYRAARVGTNAVTDDQPPSADLSAKGCEKLDDLRAADGAVEEPEVKLPPAQPRDCRKLITSEALLDHRGLALRDPGTRHQTLLREPGLVYEDDGVVFLRGVLFRAGQVFRFHCAIVAGSSRSARRARASGA